VIHSLHDVRHPALREAVADFLPREAESMREEMAALAMHGPFKRG
jgi:predicted N-acyltransferase